MGKVLVIKDADFSRNAVSSVDIETGGNVKSYVVEYFDQGGFKDDGSTNSLNTRGYADVDVSNWDVLRVRIKEGYTGTVKGNETGKGSPGEILGGVDLWGQNGPIYENKGQYNHLLITVAKVDTTQPLPYSPDRISGLATIEYK